MAGQPGPLGLWPALIPAASRFPADRLARTDQEHTASGRHVRRNTPFPDWADAECLRQAEALTEEEALQALSPSAANAR
jgi:hypothetical protein